MKAALLIVLSLSALALAGPAINKNNQIGIQKSQQQQQQYSVQEGKQSQAIEQLKQWCFSSQMSQTELTASFKKLVSIVKSEPQDQSTEAAVMGERICQGAIVQKSQQSGETVAQTDAQAHELIKDVYMDALIACETNECMQQLLKTINNQKVDAIRASYYMTRIAVSEKSNIKDESDIKHLVESFVQQTSQDQSEAIERQKLFAVTSVVAKLLKNKQQPTAELKQTAERVVKTIVERYIKPVTQQEVQQHQQQQQTSSPQVAKKIAKRNAALKALSTIPGWMLAEIQDCQQTLIELAQNKQELSSTRQSAIECLEETGPTAYKQLKQIAFDSQQEEPTEVRIAAYRALMTLPYSSTGKQQQDDQQMAAEIIDEAVKHCEDQRNHQQDTQFVLYVISHLDNLRTSQEPEQQLIKECIAKNKQHFMQIQLLNKKFKQQLQDVRKSSRNYKYGQELQQLESGLILEGDLIYSQDKKQMKDILPKLVRVNMSMPVMGESVNVIEVTLRQDNMDEELLSALKLAQGVKFNSESVSKVVDSFKQSAERKNIDTNTDDKKPEADLTIKVDGCTVFYVCLDDFKYQTSSSSMRRSTRSTYSIVEEILERLKRNPVAFNRGFNFNINERLAKVLDVDANIIAGLRFDSRASGSSSRDFEIVAQVEPRFAFEAIVGPAKMSSKKLLQRFSTKSALGLRLRYKSDELVDVQIDLPMNTMELFTFETQMVEKNSHSYTYLPESIYGQEDIYSPDEETIDASRYYNSNSAKTSFRKMQRSFFSDNKKSAIASFFQGKQRNVAYQLETSEQVARATGLRGKIRVVASPKDMSFLVQAFAQKYEPRMSGYRMQVQKTQRSSNGEQKQYNIVLSTPNSQVDRTMQVRVIVQSNSQRTVVKSDVQSPKMGAIFQCELVHDGRQWAIKTEVAASHSSNKWRHSLETGVQRSSQSQAGRLATTYKPYITIESTSMKRPIQMQGVVSYQKSPKTVISYELKCPTSGDFVQGKFIVDERSSSSSYNKYSQRRSMRSPVELLLTKDITITGEIVAQVEEHAFKVHQMVDWEPSKFVLNADLTSTYKNLRRSSSEKQVLGQLKLSQEQQMFTIQRKSPQQERKEFTLIVDSDTRSANSHKFQAEYRYFGGRSQDVVAYKHKLDVNEWSPKRRVDFGYQVELISSEHQIQEQLQGRLQYSNERKMKTLHTFVKDNMNSNKQMKVDVEFASFGEHLIDVAAQYERYQHRTTVRSDKRQCRVESRTDKHNTEMLVKFIASVEKQTGECEFVCEVPSKDTRVSVDLNLASGKQSSFAVQTPRFASKGEFTFETLRSGQKFFNKNFFFNSKMIPSSLRFKTDLKDKLNQEEYWMESAFEPSDLSKKSYFRINSPVYRSDLEYDSRDEMPAKFGLFARSKRSIGSSQQLYSNEDSILSQAFDQNKIQLGNKLWMLRSAFSSQAKMDQLKQKARRALFEYADRRQQHKHSIDYNPTEERFALQMEHQPTVAGSFQPMRISADLHPKSLWSPISYQNERPSKMSMESQWADFDFTAKPFDGQESYATISALSRHRRSPFKKHDSEIRYNKHAGYKAQVKHLDQEDRRHSWQMNSDESPKKYAKMSFDSDKYGKADWEHKWRKHSKRSTDRDELETSVYFQRQPAVGQQQDGYTYRTNFELYEPTGLMHRIRRDANSARYSAVDYLKHIQARLNSQVSKNQAELYNVDFDFQPQTHARLNVQMPEDMLHSSMVEFEPTERVYKLQSKLYNRLSQKPSYEFSASTMKPLVEGLATAEQEPIYVDGAQHSMLRQPISASLAANLFKQPVKVDYSDKYGRVARFDYNESPVRSAYAGLRHKRAAVYYKDDSMDFEHQSSYDFYPESFLGLKQNADYYKSLEQKNYGGDFTYKAYTKYGPIVFNADSNDNTVQVDIKSPVLNAKLTGETSTVKRGSQLFKLYLDNKNQKVQLAKLVRRQPILKECQLLQKFVQKIDSSKFEHQSELLISLVETIFKIKSQTYLNERPVVVIEGELNKQQDKAFVKINGERVDGQLVVDLMNKSANLNLSLDNKHTIQHQTRLVRLNEKFYSLDSMTTYKQQPLFKIQGKISSMIFTKPEHLFAKRHSYPTSSIADHISTFDATIYEPNRIQVIGSHDCINHEAHLIFKNFDEQKVQETHIKLDDRNQNILIDAHLDSPNGQIYTSQVKINLNALVNPHKCRSSQSCQSDLHYQDKSGNWAAKYLPTKYFSVQTPSMMRQFSLAH